MNALERVLKVESPLNSQLVTVWRVGLPLEAVNTLTWREPFVFYDHIPLKEWQPKNSWSCLLGIVIMLQPRSILRLACSSLELKRRREPF